LVVDRDQRHLLNHGLSNENAVEWIAMVHRQFLELLQMSGQDRQDFHTGLLGSIQEVVDGIAWNAHLSDA